MQQKWKREEKGNREEEDPQTYKPRKMKTSGYKLTVKKRNLSESDIQSFLIKTPTVRLQIEREASRLEIINDGVWEVVKSVRLEEETDRNPFESMLEAVMTNPNKAENAIYKFSGSVDGVTFEFTGHLPREMDFPTGENARLILSLE